MNGRKTGLRFGLLLCVGFGVGVDVDPAWAGAWPREAGGYYGKLSLSRFTSDEMYEAKGNKKVPGPDYVEDALYAYGEYGITSKWTVIGDMGAKNISREVTPGQTQYESGLADLWLYLKRGIADGPVVVALQGGVKVPLGYDKLHQPPLGEGQIDFEGRVLFGKSFWPVPGYGGLEAAYRRRNGDFSDEIRYRMEAGIQIVRPIHLKADLTMVDNRSRDAASSEPQSERHPNIFDQEFTDLMLSLIWARPKGVGVEVFYKTILQGGNTAAGDTFGAAVSWEN